MFIYQARQSSLVPAVFLIAQFMQKLWMYDAVVLVGKFGWGFSALLEWIHGKVKIGPSFIPPSFSRHIPFPPITTKAL